MTPARRIHSLALPLACFLGLFLGACTSQFKVVVATTQVWHGGAAGSSGGKNYEVKFSKSKQSIISIEDIWVGEPDRGWRPRFQVLPQPSDTTPRHIAHKGFTEFTLKFSVLTPRNGSNPRPGEEGVQPFSVPPAKLPAAFTHGVALFVEVDGVQDTLIIEDFQELPVLNYP